eukprot:118442-Rhodomonas_salina.1
MQQVQLQKDPEIKCKKAHVQFTPRNQRQDITIAVPLVPKVRFRAFDFAQYRPYAVPGTDKGY